MSGTWRDAYRAMGKEWQDTVFRPSQVPLIEVFRTEIAAIRSGRWSYRDAAMLAAHAVLDDEPDDDVPLDYGARSAERWSRVIEGQRELIADTERAIEHVAEGASRLRDAAKIPTDPERRGSMLGDAEEREAEAAQGRELLAARRHRLKNMEIADREGYYAGSGSEPPTARDSAYRRKAADCLEEALKGALRTLERRLCGLERRHPDATDLEMAALAGEAVVDLLAGLARDTEDHDADALGLGGPSDRMRELVAEGLKAAHGEEDGQNSLFPGVVVDPDKALCFWWAYVPQNPRVDFPHDRQMVLGGLGPRKWLYYLCHVVWKSKAKQTYLKNRDRSPVWLVDTGKGLAELNRMKHRKVPTSVLSPADGGIVVHARGELIGLIKVSTIQAAIMAIQTTRKTVVLDALFFIAVQAQEQCLRGNGDWRVVRIEGGWRGLLVKIGHPDHRERASDLAKGFAELAGVYLRIGGRENLGLVTLETRPATGGGRAELTFTLGNGLVESPEQLAEHRLPFMPFPSLPPLVSTSKEKRPAERGFWIDTIVMLRDSWGDRPAVTVDALMVRAAEHGLGPQAERIVKAWCAPHTGWLTDDGGVIDLADQQHRGVLHQGRARSLESSRRGRRSSKAKGRGHKS